MKNILIIAAENSAENYGCKIIDRFRTSKFKISFFGAGGEEFLKRGVDLTVHNRELSIVGIVEVVSSLLRMKKIMGKLLSAAKQKNADAAILIDYPDFNLRLAKKLKRSGIPVFYYISPTLWAWRYSRIKLIRKYVDHMFLIFPFEKKIYKREGVPFTYTGHPLIPSIKVSTPREQFRTDNKVPGEKKIVALLPGSRLSEVETLLPGMLRTIRLLAPFFDLKVFILKADNIGEKIIEKIVKNSGIDVTITDQSDRYNLFNASDAALASCGTSNLEIAICSLPFVAVYRVNHLSYMLGKGLLRISLYSIVNILLGKAIIKEFIQKDFTAENCSKALSLLLTDENISRGQKKEFLKLKELLSEEIPPSEIIFNKLVSLIFKKNNIK